MGALRNIIALAMCITMAFMTPARETSDKGVGPEQGNQTGQTAPVTKTAAIDPQADCTAKSGTWGTVPWQIATGTDGVCTLTVHSGVSPVWGDTLIPWYDNSSVTKLVIDGDLTLINNNRTGPGQKNGAFTRLPGLQTVDITGILRFKDWGACSLFYGDKSLKGFTDGSLDKIDTSQAVDLTWMFWGCSGLTTLKLPKWDTSKVTNVTGMFISCSGLTSLTLPAWDFSNVTNIGYMFWGCLKLTYLDIRNLDTSHAVNKANRPVSYAYALPPNLRELWLGPNTPMSTNSGDTFAFRNIPSTYRWEEEKPIGSDHYIPVPDITTRTAMSPVSPAGPAGHYKCGPNTVSVTVIYSSVDTATTSHDAGTAGTQQITWSGHQPEPGKVFDGWDFHTTDPDNITFDPATNTVAWNTSAWDPSATLTAKWRSIDKPAISKPVVHAPVTGGTSVDITVKAPAGSKPGDTITLTSTPTGSASASWSYALKAGETAYTFTGIAVPQLRAATNFTDSYHLMAHMSATSHFDGTIADSVVVGADSVLDGILPYTTLTYRPGAGTGTPPDDTTALTDTTTLTAALNPARPDTITRPAHSVFTHWQTGTHELAVGTTTAVPTAWGTTDANGHTTVTLTAQWSQLAAPLITAIRDPRTNQVTITGTASPWHDTDTIHVCHPVPGNGTQCDTYTPWTGQTGPAFDGATAHTWTVILPADTPEGQASATLTTNDTAYPIADNTVESPASTTDIPSLWAYTLPLTGGTPQQAMLLLAVVLATVLLLTAAAAHLRNQRRKARHCLR